MATTKALINSSGQTPHTSSVGSAVRAVSPLAANSLGRGSKSLHTPVGDAPLLPVTLLMIGAYIAWFGIHYFKSDVVWPSDPIKSLLTGKGLPPAAKTGEQATSAAVDAAFTTTPTSAPGAGGSGGITNTAYSSTTAAPAGTTFNHAQLETLWVSSGGSQGTANRAAAQAQAESGGNSTATSGNPDGGTNVGLWQLDTPGGKGAGHTIEQLKDPTTNAQVAIMGSSNGTDWSAWATAYGNPPAYLKFMA